MPDPHLPCAGPNKRAPAARSLLLLWAVHSPPLLETLHATCTKLQTPVLLAPLLVLFGPRNITQLTDPIAQLTDPHLLSAALSAHGLWRRHPHCTLQPRHLRQMGLLRSDKQRAHFEARVEGTSRSDDGCSLKMNVLPVQWHVAVPLSSWRKKFHPLTACLSQARPSLHAWMTDAEHEAAGLCKQVYISSRPPRSACWVPT